MNNFGRNIQNSIDYLVQLDGSIDNIDKFKAENLPTPMIGRLDHAYGNAW